MPVLRVERPVLDLDRPDARVAAASDPSFIVSGPGPVLIAQSLTGRAHIMNVLPLSQGELYGRRESLVDQLWSDPARLPEIPSRPVTRDEYVNRILADGFPMILQRLTTRARTSWFAGYVDLVVMRDVLDIARVRQREAFPGYSASSQRRPARC
jgi:hypothetical protein